MSRPHVICVGGEGWRDRVTDTLAAALDGVTVVGTTDPDAALGELDAVTTRAVVSAPSLGPDQNGTALLSAARESAPEVACILFGDLGGLERDASGPTVVQAVDERDPDADAELVALVERAVEGGGRPDYPLPDDEPARLDAVTSLPTVDERLETAFGRLSDLAAAAFDAEYAYVSTMGAARQEHRAVHGFEGRKMGRERSICAYTVAADEVTVFRELDTDPRFDGVDYVAELGLEWYAGAPVRVDGRVVGTLCVLGREGPDSIDEALLQAMADEAADQFEFARLRASGSQ